MNVIAMKEEVPIMADCVENDSNRNASQFGDVVLIGVGYIKNIKGSHLTDLVHLSLRNPIYVDRRVFSMLASPAFQNSKLYESGTETTTAMPA